MWLASRRAPSAYFRNYGFELFVFELLSAPLLEPLAPAPAPAPELELPELELPELELLPGLVALPSLGELDGELLIELELRPLLDPVLSPAPPWSFLLHPTKASATPIIRSIFFI